MSKMRKKELIKGNKLKFVVLSFYEAYPPESGAAAVTFNTALNLPGQTTLIQLGDVEQTITLSDSLDCITIASESQHRLKKALALQNKFRRISELIRELDPDWLVLEGASWAPYYVFQLARLRRAGLTFKVIYHAHNVEYLLRLERKDRLIAGLTRWAEGKLMKGSDLATAVSESDANQFHRLYGVRPAVLPNGVDVSVFDSVSERDISRIKEKYNITGFPVLFMGLISYPPTKEGLRFLMDGVFPSLTKLRRDIKLVVIGGDVGESRDWLINPGIIPFEEVPALIKACRVCAAPIFTGSGTRVKILEYLAAGKAVISTSKGAEGLEAVGDKHLVLAEDEAAFKSSILNLVEDESLAVMLGKQGRELVEKRYDWNRIFDRFSLLLEDIARPKINKRFSPEEGRAQDGNQ
jgi:glycosyltransferase involved in cell wall biosynthesis